MGHQFSIQKGRVLIWSGLAARCSMCGWRRIYEEGAVTHKLPNAELSKTIHKEYVLHNCKDFPLKATDTN